MVAGCGNEAKKEDQRPLVRRTIPEVMGALEQRALRAVPIKGNGTCRLDYYVDGKKKKEEFPVKFWVRPEHDVYLQGDIAFDARALVVGANSQEFWVSLRPKEISSYWWGRWDDAGSDGALMISPRVVLEGLGVIRPVEGGVWDMGWDKGLEILTQRSESNVLQKRIYVADGNEVRRIEYYDPFGALSVTATLEKYEEAAEGFAVPTLVTMIRHGIGGKNDSVRMTIKKVTETQISQKQADYLFKRPEPDGFEHVRMSVGGRWVEQY